MRRGLLLAVGLVALAGCKSSPMARIEALRDALALGDRDAVLATAAVPACPEPRTVTSRAACLDAAARAFGGTGFNATHPDQASAAAVAFVLVRDRDGVGVPAAETWLEAVAHATGPGADALRLAVAGAMSDAAPRVGKAIDDEPAARDFLAAVAASIPGACSAYGQIGKGADVAGIPAADGPDHSPCVQADLTRQDGPGAAYGDGLWRAAAGAAALWRDESRAIGIGFGTTDGKTRHALVKRLGTVHVATHDLAVHLVATTQTAEYGKAAAHAGEVTDAGARAPGKAPRP